MNQELVDFVRESNVIENIYRESLQPEIDELSRFMKLDRITIDELIHFVSIYQPDARLRDQYNMNVRIGSYYPPFGGPEIRPALQEILDSDIDSYTLHVRYEKLHPFTDGNGRSGRALWAWKEQDISQKFLLRFYYQTLQHS